MSEEVSRASARVQPEGETIQEPDRKTLETKSPSVAKRNPEKVHLKNHRYWIPTFVGMVSR